MNPAFRMGLFAFPIQQLTNKNCFFDAAKSDRQTRVVGNRAARIPDKLCKSQSLIDLLCGFRATRILIAVVNSRVGFSPLRAVPRPPHATSNASSPRTQAIRVAGVAHTTRCTSPVLLFRPPGQRPFEYTG